MVPSCSLTVGLVVVERRIWSVMDLVVPGRIERPLSVRQVSQTFVSPEPAHATFRPAGSRWCRRVERPQGERRNAPTRSSEPRREETREGGTASSTGPWISPKKNPGAAPLHCSLPQREREGTARTTPGNQDAEEAEQDDQMVLLISAVFHASMPAAIRASSSGSSGAASLKW